MPLSSPFSLRRDDGPDTDEMQPGMIAMPSWMRQTPPPQMGGDPTQGSGAAPVTTAAAPAPKPTAAPMTSAPVAPPPSPAVSELNRLTVRTPASMANGKYDITKDQSRSGIEQIHNPFLRTLGRIGDAALSTVLPAAAVFTPGTQLHHQMDVNAARNAVTDEEAEQKAQEEALAAPGTREHTAAETALENAQAHNLENPPNPKEWDQSSELIIDPEHPELGPQVAYVNKNDPTQIKFMGSAGARPTEDKTTANVHVLPDGTVVSVNHDPKTGKSTAEVVYKGDPKEGPPKIVQLQKNGKPHQVLVKEDGTEIKDLGETGEKPPTINVNAETSALDRESARFAKTHEANVKAANDQLDKITDARSMLTTGNAESQALAIPKVLTALISGQGTGVRITQPELNALASARGIKGDFQAWVSKISSGKRLTPEQQAQLVGVLDAASARLEQKRAIANHALDLINSGASRADIVKADKEARDALAAFEKGGGGTQRITGDADYEKLPSGAHFIGPDGKERVKP